MDPGSVNFAFCHRKDGQVSSTGWLKTMPSVEDDTEFVNGYIELLVKTKPDHVIFERFMVRNRGQSVYAEKINLMLGRIVILTRMYARCNPLQLTAAQWKNFYQKKSLDSAMLHPNLPSVHLQDAAAMALYADDYWIEEHHKQRSKK